MLGLMHIYSASKTVFNDSRQIQKKLAAYKNKWEEERLKVGLIEYEMDAFKQHVATVLPNFKKSGAEDYPVRNIASLVQTPRIDRLQFEPASSLMAKGKKYFQEKDYLEANKLFRKITSRFPNSRYIIEAHFFLSEGSYLLGDYDETLRAVDQMVALYPESELTGFALVRLGNIFELQERFEDAAEIYQVIERTYPEPRLKRQARVLLKGVRP
jgi:TolA-binding protein